MHRRTSSNNPPERGQADVRLASINLGIIYGYCAFAPKIVNLCKIDISIPVIWNGMERGSSGCFRPDRVYSPRRLRHRDNLPPLAKARPGGSACARMGARLSINSDGRRVMKRDSAR